MNKQLKKVIGTFGGAMAATVLLTVPTYASSVQSTKVNTKVYFSTYSTPDFKVIRTAITDIAASQSPWDKVLAADVTNYAHIREGASTETNIVGILRKGAAAVVVEEGSEWTKISSGEVTGYIRNDLFLTKEQAKALYEETFEIKDADPEKLEHLAFTMPQWQEVLKAEEQARADARAKKAKERAERKAQAEAKQTEAQQATSQQAAQPVTEQAQVQTETAATEAAEPQQEAPQEESQTVSAGSGELDLLAAIIQCEAGGEAYEGKIAVGAVIMNRVNSGKFPSSITDVVYQRGQFSPVASGKLARTLSAGAREDCYAAAQDVLNGANNVGDALYFNSGRGKGLQIGNQHFY